MMSPYGDVSIVSILTGFGGTGSSIYICCEVNPSLMMSSHFFLSGIILNPVTPVGLRSSNITRRSLPLFQRKLVHSSSIGYGKEAMSMG